MEFIDYYKILELDKSATDADIKAAYRKLARKYHPDVNPNDNAAKNRFQQINEANEVLSDPDKRKKYDKYGKDWKHADELDKNAQYRSRTTRQDNQDHVDFSDFFESMFGGGSRGGRMKYKGEDYTTEIHFGLKDAYTTQQQTLNVNGKAIRLTIPAGVENGQTIKIPGKGGEGINGGANGDLYVTFSISAHPKFRREGHNLHTTVELNLYTAVLGGDITIETFDGKVKLPVKPETQNGTKVKLKGKGFPVYKKEGQFGDLFVTYDIKIPTHLSEKEKDLFRELSKIGDHA